MGRSWLHRCAVLLSAISFLSVCTGTAVTSNEERPFYSVGQNHMWLGITAGILTIAVAVLIRSERERTWLRWLGWSGLAAVVLQAVVGFQPLPQSPAARIAHAGMAQLFFPATMVIAICTSRAWNKPPKRTEGGRPLQMLANSAPIVVLAQVALGTLFRHGAIGVGPHLFGAFVIAFFILGLTLSVIYRPEHSSLHLAARALLTIASAQVFVGLALLSMQSMDVDPPVVILMTMIHAATGALTLAATVTMAVLIRRNVYIPGGPAK